MNKHRQQVQDRLKDGPKRKRPRSSDAERGKELDGQGKPGGCGVGVRQEVRAIVLEHEVQIDLLWGLPRQSSD